MGPKSGYRIPPSYSRKFLRTTELLRATSTEIASPPAKMIGPRWRVFISCSRSSNRPTVDKENYSEQSRNDFWSVGIPLAIYRSGKDLAAGNVVQSSGLGRRILRRIYDAFTHKWRTGWMRKLQKSSEETTSTIHTFADASKAAYGAVSLSRLRGWTCWCNIHKNTGLISDVNDY